MKEKYPHLPKELYKKRVLLDSEISEITALYKEGWSLKALAKKFDVSGPTIHWHVDPEWREKVKEKNRIYNNERYASDEKFRQRIKDSSMKALNRRRRVFPPLKEALYEAAAERRRNNKEWIKNYNKKYREEKGGKIDAKIRMNNIIRAIDLFKTEGRDVFYEKYKHKPSFIENVLKVEPLLILIK